MINDKSRISLSIKYGIILFLLLCSIGLSLTVYHTNKFKEVTDNALGLFNRTLQQNLHEELKETGLIISDTLVRNLIEPVTYRNYDEMFALIRQFKNNHKVIYSNVYDQSGLLIHDGTDLIKHYGQFITEIYPEFIDTNNPLSPSTYINQNAIHISSPIYVDGNFLIGFIRFGMRFPHLEKSINNFKSQIQVTEYKNRLELRRSNFMFMGLFWLVACMAAILFVSKMSNPIKILSLHAKAIGKGEYDTKVSLNQNDELGELADNLDQMRINLKKQLLTIRNMAYIDELTCLPNRRSFTDKIEQFIQLELPFHILFIDLDDFKRINDQFGHETGDIYLKEYCNNITSFCSNNFPNDYFHIARMGGDEITILIQQHALSVVDVGLFSNQLCNALSIPISLKDKRLDVSLSIGVTSFPQDADNSSQLLSYADIALYQAKSLGKKMAVVFDSRLLKMVLAEYSLKDKLNHAIDNNLFYLNYQPIIDIKSKKSIGFEVLVRLGYGDNRVSPEVFIPLAEKMSIIDKVTYQVIDQVCFDLKNSSNFSGTISINISGLLIDSIDFYHKTMSILNRYDIAANRIALEVTETVMISNFESAIEGLKRLKKAGFTLYLDDFGSGYSSLKYLQKLPIDIVKIDKNLIQNAANGISIFSSIINLCKALELKIVVEGVETLQQLDICHQTGCDLVQGYYFSKPMKWNDCKPYQNTLVEFIGQPTLSEPVKIDPV